MTEATANIFGESIRKLSLEIWRKPMYVDHYQWWWLLSNGHRDRYIHRCVYLLFTIESKDCNWKYYTCLINSSINKLLIMALYGHKPPAQTSPGQPVHRQGPEWLSVTGLSLVRSSSSCKGQDVHMSPWLPGWGCLATTGHYTWGCACGLCKHTVALLNGFKVQPSQYVIWLLGIRQNKCSFMKCRRSLVISIIATRTVVVVTWLHWSASLLLQSLLSFVRSK